MFSVNAPLVKQEAPDCLNEFVSAVRSDIASLARRVDLVGTQMDLCLVGINTLRAATPPPCVRGSEDKSHRSSDADSRDDYSVMDGLQADRGQPEVSAAFLSSAVQPGPAKSPFPDSPQVDWMDRRRSSTSTVGVSAAAVSVLQRRRGAIGQAIWNFLEDPESSKAALWFSHLWPALVMATVCVTLLQSVKSQLLDGTSAAIVDLVFDAAFAIEVILRFVACPSFWVFFKSAYNIIDLLAALPLPARVAILCRGSLGGAEETEETFARVSLYLLCIVPVLRLLKTLRQFQQFHLFLAVLSFTREALKFLLLLLALIVLVFSSLIYLVEPRENIETLPMAMWLTVVTMTTVGYGDVTPDSNAGHCITTALLLASVLYMAMPIGIIGNAFTEMWKDRDRILLSHRFHDHMVQCGYTAEDVVVLFKHYDADNNDELSINEFINMVLDMQLGLNAERAVRLFESIDKDGSGGIDCKEFVRSFYPTAYQQLYGHKTSQREEDSVKPKKRKSGHRSSRSSPMESEGSLNGPAELLAKPSSPRKDVPEKADADGTASTLVLDS